MLHLSLSPSSSASAAEQATTRRQLAALGATVAKSAKVIVVSGAGVSCSCGIPDFRSANGLYNLVKERYPETVVSGKDLFSSTLFRSPDTTSLFFSFVAELKLAVDGVDPSRTHRFVRRLEETGKLVRSYTQNIDGLEKRAGVRCSSSVEGEAAGRAPPGSVAAGESSTASSSRSPSPPPSSLPPPSSSQSSDWTSTVPQLLPAPMLDRKTTKNVQLHGDLHALRCTVCAASYKFVERWVAVYKEGECISCPSCEERVGVRVARGQRALSTGVLRPGIVLYDENHPSGDLIGDLQAYDVQRSPDLLLVLGTSLKVHGLKRLVKELAKGVHGLAPTKARPEGGKGRVVFVNKTPPGKEWEGVFDVWVEGECDDWVDGVEKEWRRVRARDWESQTTLVGVGAKAKAVKSATAAGKPVKGLPKPVKGLPKAAAKADKDGESERKAAPPSLSRSPIKKEPSKAASDPTSAIASSSLAYSAPRAARAPPPSSPLPALSSPAHAHVLSPAQRAINVPARAQPPSGLQKSPKKKARVLDVRGASKGKGRAFSSDESDGEGMDEDSEDDDVLLVERALDGTVKLSPVGRFSALPSLGGAAPAEASNTPRRRRPPPPPAFAPSSTPKTEKQQQQLQQQERPQPTPGRSTPRAPLPASVNGARKRAPGTPVEKASPFLVRPPPAGSAAIALAGAQGRRMRAEGRAANGERQARLDILRAAGVLDPRSSAEVIELD